ncbi:MAG: WYL domain-containing protein [Lachnospiraceae bacterium]|nr:WYL domain-containing protein [Lachnospiraceae bacterium]
MAFSNQGSSDNKQHINLSCQAWEIINYDRYRFFVNTTQSSSDRTDQQASADNCQQQASTDNCQRQSSADNSKKQASADNNQLPLSTFLNRIFHNFYETANASLSLYEENYAEKLRELLADVKSGETGECSACTEALIQKLTDTYIKTIQDKHKKLFRGNSAKFRLNNENFAYLTDPDSNCREDHFYSSIGQYLKALFEEYASLTHLQRDQIYYRPVFEKVEQAFNTRTALHVTHLNGLQFEFKPYAILNDQTSTFHYLIGYSTPLNMSVDYDVTHQKIPCQSRPACFRISNIRKIDLLRRKSGKLTAKQTEELEQVLHTNGPQFMTDATHEIRIRLTPKGIMHYNYQLTLRPSYDEIIDGNIYVFHCSERQIEYYFLSFGDDALILEPKRLQQHFEKIYQSAAKAYQDAENTPASITF